MSIHNIQRIIPPTTAEIIIFPKQKKITKTLSLKRLLKCYAILSPSIASVIYGLAQCF